MTLLSVLIICAVVDTKKESDQMNFSPCKQRERRGRRKKAGENHYGLELLQILKIKPHRKVEVGKPF